MTLDPKVQRIIDWRESFATLPDAHFFELIRMYLGEVKTPYNKQKLIEELGSFIRKEDNKNKLLSLLTQNDIEILSAVKYISPATQEKLASFFNGSYSYATLYEAVLNLEERLVLYRHVNKDDGKTIISINPLLEDALSPFVSIDVLIEKTVFAEKNESLPFTLNPQFIASFVSFTLSHHDMCKADGAFKKRAVTELREVYLGSEENGGMEKRLQLLATGLCNLSLFHEDDEGIAVDKVRLAAFAQLPPSVQYAYLAVASCAHLSRSTLQLNAQLLLDVLASVPRNGYTRTSIMRLSFIAQQNTGLLQEEFTPSGRFQRLLNEGTVQTTAGIMAGLIDVCLSFGILYVMGKNTAGQEVLAVSPLFTEQSSPLPGDPKVLSIDAVFSVTIMPGLSLAQLLPLTEFMDCVRYDTAAVFEISKQSVMRSFDNGCTPQQIFGLIEKYSAYGLSQNLSISIEEWYHSYSSASLYKGYVLKVSEEKHTLVEKNPVLAPYIRQTLCPGVYLLSITSDEEARLVIQKSGLDFIGNIKTAQVENETLGLPVLTAQKKSFDETEQSPDAKKIMLASNAVQKKIITELHAELEKLDLTVEQKEGLADRIDRRIIVNPVQLRGTSVRFERLEAGGMDYNGKIHVVDSALANNCMIEIECDDSDTPLVGTPLLLNKKSENAMVRVRLEPSQEIRDISVGGARRIKKIRGTITQ